MSDKMEKDVAVLLVAVEGLRVREKKYRERIEWIEGRLAVVERRLHNVESLEHQIEDQSLWKIRPEEI
ncbi:hypothetical protein E2C06_33830 [Dankookia rubra]|uniref:Uncharacterized protein n=1 Tax=Dankookia rubra TaxID=1442381 RepID=A0A4R5Q6Z1_9PROT|nr:hypothetical protein [Dankookia rubra]TDH58208.1 hypothetical protein E2C06_33830 [Dankookia rubra]